MLATADLSGNYINSIGDIQQHKYLECLILASNCITRISGLQGLEYLSVRRGATADSFLDSNTGLCLFNCFLRLMDDSILTSSGIEFIA
jgi:hypothetical protein